MSADLKPVKINGELFWSKWMAEFNTAFNSDNDRYECTIGNISDDDAAKLTGLGIKVKHKEAMGNFIVAKSKYLFNPTDDSMKEINVADLGNGSKCVAVISSYTHRMSAKHGNAPTVKKLMVTEVKTYVPPTEEDDDSSDKERPKLAIIDADIICYRVGFASEDVDEAICLGRVTQLIHEIVYDNLRCDDYKAYITGRTNFRNEIAVTEPYKGNRKDAKKPQHYIAIRNHLQRLGAELVEGQEADDAVAIEATKTGGWIVSIDKDLDQVAGWHYNFVKHEEYYVTEEEGLRNLFTQVLTGDRIDNIIGLKGIGPKKAEKLLKDCKTEREYYDACLKAYDGNQLRVDENLNLLWLRREPNQMCPLVSTSLGVNGTSSS